MIKNDWGIVKRQKVKYIESVYVKHYLFIIVFITEIMYFEKSCLNFGPCVSRLTISRDTFEKAWAGMNGSLFYTCEYIIKLWRNNVSFIVIAS